MLRRIFVQVSALAGCVAAGLTLWLALKSSQLEFFQACLRAVGVGVAVMGVSLLLRGLIDALGGPPSHTTEHHETHAD